MKSQIEKKLNKKTISLFVPVDSKIFQKGKKENLILSVGRFFPYLHSKKYEVLIDAFKKLSLNNSKWTLSIAGSVDPGSEEYVKDLKKLAKGFSITFHEDISFTEVQKLYSRASIYWHASGFGEDPIIHPERLEHFGVSTVEAMASGCVPLAYNAGGQPEIIQEGVNGFLWNTKEELVDKTAALISNRKKINQYSTKAIKRSQNYSVELFYSKINELAET